MKKMRERLMRRSKRQRVTQKAGHFESFRGSQDSKRSNRLDRRDVRPTSARATAPAIGRVDFDEDVG